MGKYQSNPGASACSWCPPGQWQTTTGQSFCTGCLAGTYRNNSLTGCTDCAKGTFASIAGQTACTPCGRLCSHCSLFFLCHPVVVACVSGQGTAQSNTRQTFCSQCQPGTFSAQQVRLIVCVRFQIFVFFLQGLLNCLACPRGSFQGSPKAIACTFCDAGT